jgi:hypothetical protein
MCIKINSRQTGSRNLMGPKMLPTIWGDSYFLFADLVGFYTHWTYMHIFRHIFLSNYWWQKSDIWSQASYRYPIWWEAFLDPSDSKTLPTILRTNMKIVTKYQISAIKSCWEKCDEKLAYMFNVYKNQQSQQTGSRNLMGPKTLPTIWGTYMKLVTKYQISAINNSSDSCFPFSDLVGFYTHLTYMHIFLSNYWWQESDIWSQASCSKMPYCGKLFWTLQIPTSCLFPWNFTHVSKNRWGT